MDIFGWWNAEKTVLEKRAGRVVRLAAIPDAPRRALIALLRRGDDVGPAASLPDTAAVTAFFAAIAAFVLLVMLLPGALALASFGGVGYWLGFLLPVFLGGAWPAMVVVRFAWERLVAMAPPGQYLFATGIVEISRGGLVRFVPRSELTLSRRKVVVRRIGANASTRSYVVVEAKTSSGLAYTFHVSASMLRSTDEEAGRLGAQEARLRHLHDTQDHAALAVEDPFAWALRLDVWPTLGPELPAQPGVRAIPTPRVLYGGPIGALLVSMVLGTTCSPCVCGYGAFQYFDESGSTADLGCIPECAAGREICARSDRGETRCVDVPPQCRSDVSCGCIESVFPVDGCEDAGGGRIGVFVRR